MTEQQLAFTVRDNAIHQWRRVDEIAEDEGVALEALVRCCEQYLTALDLTDIISYARS